MSEKFRSKKGFVFACVGAAVGLGNALRFPGLCARFGGGAFLCVYLVALMFLGIPLLNAEIALGRKVKGGAPYCLESAVKGGRALGWAQCANSLLTAITYMGLAGWILSAASDIFGICTGGIAGSGAGEYFFGEVLKARPDGVISGISPAVCAFICVAWIFAFFCLKGGAGALSGCAAVTVTVPVALLLFMSARGLFFAEAPRALSALFLPDFSRLASPALWAEALGQVFFSLSVAVGIMPTFGGYLPEKTGIFPRSLVIAAADALVSVVASVALFTTMYGCGLEGETGRSGIITAFSVYPEALARLTPYPVFNGVAGVMFYLSLALMAMQSGVSMLEAFVNPFVKFSGKNRKRVAAVICAAGGALSLIFATTAGKTAVETADVFVNFFNVLALCIAECLALGYGRQFGGLADEINAYSGRLKISPGLFAVSIKILCPAVLAMLAVTQLPAVFSLSCQPWVQFAFGWGTSLAIALFALLSLKRSPPA